MSGAETVAAQAEAIPPLPMPNPEHKPREHCGVWAAWDPGNDKILEHAYIGAKGVEHRGEEGTGISCIVPGLPDIHSWRGAGRVDVVFGENGDTLLREMPGSAHAVVIQTRYGTDSYEGDGTQPCLAPPERPQVALAHNGQITNGPELAERHEITEYTTDSDLITRVIYKVAESYDYDYDRTVAHVLPELEGAFCLAILTGDKLIAARDRNAIRPFQLGRSDTGGYIVSSEVKAITDVPGASWEREIEPGEMVVISSDGIRSGRWAKAERKSCFLEFAYLSNKNNIINGHVVGDVRQQLGAMLWEEFERQEQEALVGENDISLKALFEQIRKAMAEEETKPKVVPVPNGGNQSAHGFSQASELPEVKALEKAAGAGRSFIQPNNEARVEVTSTGVLLVDGEMVKDEILFLNDDTKVRGNAARVVAKLVRKAGAKKIIMAIAAPPVVDTCPLGVDIGTKEELVAVQEKGDIDAISKAQGVERVIYLPPDAPERLLGKTLCMRCFGGDGPSYLNEAAAPEGSKQLAIAAV